MKENATLYPKYEEEMYKKNKDGKKIISYKY